MVSKPTKTKKFKRINLRRDAESASTAALMALAKRILADKAGKPDEAKSFMEDMRALSHESTLLRIGAALIETLTPGARGYCAECEGLTTEQDHVIAGDKEFHADCFPDE